MAIVSGNAKHKLTRLHYVRATAEEAANVCRANHSDNRWKPSQNDFRSMYLRDTERLNNFVMGMISVCLRGTQEKWSRFVNLEQIIDDTGLETSS